MTDQQDALYDGTGPSTKTSIWTKSTGAGQTSMQSVGNTLYFGNGVDQKKWLQTVTSWTASTLYSSFMNTFLIDGNGNIQQLLATLVHITNVAITSNEVTITCDRALTTILQPGLQIIPSGLTATSLNGQTLTIDTVVGSTFTAAFSHANYTSAPDSGIGLVLQSGNAYSGTVLPTWNVSVGGTTDDSGARWINRGSPIMNWGIQPPVDAPVVALTGNSGSWRTNTYYSPDGLIIDSNGHLQQVTTEGVSGVGAPSWATSIGATTNDGSVLWTCIQTSLAWQSNHQYDPTTTPPPYITANAGGVNCLFKLNRGPGLTLTADGAHPGLPVTLYYLEDSAPGGTSFGDHGDTQWAGWHFANATGFSLASAHISQTYHITSLLYNPVAGRGTSETWPSTFPTLNGAGEVTGTTSPITSQRQTKYALAFTGAFTVPAPGNYTFTVTHDDGFLFGIQGATLISGPTTNPFVGSPWFVTTTGVMGYPITGANNQGGFTTDTYVVYFPTAGNYNFEFDYAQWEDSYTFRVDIGSNIVPSPFESATVSPTFPAWTQVGAPSKPSVYDARYNASVDYVSPSSTVLQWVNQGPVADMTWRAKTRFAAGGGIVDSNGNGQVPYQSGITGTVAPIWKTGINAITTDAPNLVWLCTGTAPAAIAGTISTYVGGWKYAIALVNSLDNTVSNCSPLSVSTGNFVGAAGVTFAPGEGLPAVIDPQVDYVAIFRSVDGGFAPYLIPGVDNCLIATVTLAAYQANGYTDTTPDTGLNNLLSGPILGENTPPLPGAINLAYHLNRLFFSVGNTVYWTSGADSPIGNGINGYTPSTNWAEMQSLVVRIVPTALGAFVFTVSDSYVITGNASTTPLFPELVGKGVGLLSYNAMDVQGSTIYMMTSDRQVIGLDTGATGGNEIGFPISDQFRHTNWDPSNVYLTWHVDGDDKGLFVSDGATGWFHLIATPAPESGFTWSTFATIAGGCKAVQSVEVTPGVHKLLVGPSGTGPVLQRDLTHFTDNGTAYTWNFTIGSIVLAQSGQLAELSHIATICPAIGSRPIVSVLLDEALPYYTGDFETLSYWVPEPPNKPESESLYSQRFYFSQSELPAICQHIQMNFAWVAENFQNELLACTLFGGYQQEE